MKIVFNYIFKLLAIIIAFICAVIFYFVTDLSYKLPVVFYRYENHAFSLDNMDMVGVGSIVNYNREELSSSTTPASTTVKMNLWGVIPIKNAQLKTIPETYLIPGGTVFGIKLFTRGVMVVDLNDVQTSNGLVSPAKSVGIQVGDLVISVNQHEITSNEQLADLIVNSGGEALSVVISRDGYYHTVMLSPALNSIDGKYKSGMWVRDSTAGIGTVTYYNPVDQSFAGLGHGVTDIDTGKIMPIDSGEVCEVIINGVSKGLSGTPGELQGAFKSHTPVGSLIYNGQTGIYGYLNSVPQTAVEAIMVGLKQDVYVGDAQIMATVDQEGVQLYDITIESVNLNPNTLTKNMVIKITDQELLAKTGGIVQGMSGSPIIQDGKIIGAVTHVFVNSPDKGYGIFVENMIGMSEEIG